MQFIMTRAVAYGGVGYQAIFFNIKSVNLEYIRSKEDFSYPAKHWVSITLCIFCILCKNWTHYNGHPVIKAINNCTLLNKAFYNYILI